MVIDAMDLLYTHRFDGFCLVSSDSDFTKLASRIREFGLVVYGCGVRTTPKPFVAACNKFIYVENLTPGSNLIRQVDVDGAHDSSAGDGMDTSNSAADWLRAAVEATSDEDGWAGLSDVGNLVLKRHPDFDSRNYGFTKLSELVGSLSGMFEISRRSPGRGKAPVPYARTK